MKENKDWKKELKDLYNSCGFDHVSNCGCFGECNCVDNLTKLENFIEQIISERDKEWEKWKVLAEAMDNAPVGHRVTIKHLLGEDEWTLTRRNK